MSKEPSGNRWTAVSAEELRLVDGGGRVWDKVKGAAKWVAKHVVIELKNRLIGIKGTF